MSTHAQDRLRAYRGYRLLTVGGVSIHNIVEHMDDQEFFDFCTKNADLQIEQDKYGNIIIMSPVSFDTGYLENLINTKLTNWSLESGLGRTYSPSTLFILPDGEKRMSDAAWVSNENLSRLTPAERKAFARLVPDFIIELKSPTDHPADLDKKIREVWIANGVRMAWYLDPETEVARIYHLDGRIKEYQGYDQALSGGEVLPGFVFDLKVLRD